MAEERTVDDAGERHDSSSPLPIPGNGLVDRVDRLWHRHGRRFWILHSIWALATGVVVLVLAHERYGFIPWVVGFLALTWGSTLLFSRPAGPRRASLAQRFGHGLASYLTRVLYQETLFFLLPFYFHSTVLSSWNVLFVVFLACLAVLACLDLVFDRWLRNSPVFSLVFFASVAFAALNLLLPLLARIPPRRALLFAALGAVASAAPLAARGAARHATGTRVRLALATVAFLAFAVFAHPLVPPVPLRVEHATFAADVSRESLDAVRPLGRAEPAESLSGRIAILVEVFAPSAVPASIALDWTRDGETIRTSREVEIVAHAKGFRIWDAFAPTEGMLAPGRYRVVLRTASGQVFGAAAIRLT